MANALKLKAADSVYSGVQRVSERAANTAKTIADAANSKEKTAAAGKARKPKGAAAAAVAGLVDPLQLWGSLTQQFQHIAANALKDASTKTATDMTKNVATGLAKEALKTATGAGAKKTAARPAAKKPVRKTAPKR